MMPQQKEQQIFGNNRLAMRADVNAEVFLRQSGSTMFPVTILDLSLTGFKMTSRTSLDASKPVFMRMPGLPILSARIRWEGFLDYGCQFITPLQPEVLENLLLRLRG